MIQLEGRVPKLLVLFILCLITGGLFSVVGVLLVEPFFGIPIQGVSDVFSDLESETNIMILKFIQVFNTVGLFWIPGILFVVLFYKKPLEFLGLKKPINSVSIFLILLLFLSFFPILNLVAKLNMEMQLPSFLSELELWIKSSEAKAENITKAFLRMDQPSDLWFNIILVGILPAVGEELIFRGIIQQVINEGKRNYHIGIWISALLFSALHFQFYGFFPRLLLGAFFGYLFVWSRNLWLPIFAHFLNNTFALFVVYYLGVDAVEQEIDQLGATQETYIYVIAGTIIFSGLLLYSRKLLRPKNEL